MKKAFLLLILPLMLAASPFLEGRISTTSVYLYDNPTVINLPCGIKIDTRSVDWGLGNDLLLAGEQTGVGTYLVQFDGPIYDYERRGLLATGAEIEEYIPHYTYLVRMNASTADKVRSLSGVTWVGDYQPGYKICPEISQVDATPRELKIFLYAGSKTESVENLVVDLGGVILRSEANQWETIIHVSLAPTDLVDVVHLPEVKWVEPFYQDYIYNEDAQWVVQTWDISGKTRRIWDEGLKGEGQIIHILDSGIRTSHNFFRDDAITVSDWGNYPDHRKIVGYQSSNSPYPTFGDDIVVGHGTHVSGSALGYDDPVGGTSGNDGMAPEAKLYMTDGGSNSNPFVIFRGLDLEAELTTPYGHGAKISSHSWGSQSTRVYNTDCLQIDRAMWNRKDLLVLSSGGNTDGGPYTGSPANGKNLIAVGATGDGVAAGSFASSTSSIGPSGDGRIRPDLAAPGTDIMSSRSTTDNAEITYAGTSMACPIVAGTAALIRQYLTEGWYPTGVKGEGTVVEPTGALLKALLINSCEPGFWERPIPDVGVGWGRPTADNVLYFPGDDRVLWLNQDEILTTGEQFTTEIDVKNSSEPLYVTLNWTDKQGTGGADPALVDNLDLEVRSPSGTTYKGNVFATENMSDESLTGGSADVLNPTENVRIKNPETGIWEITVKAINVPAGSQDFALVATFNGSAGGTVEEIPNLTPLSLNTHYTPGSDFFSVYFALPHSSPVQLVVYDATGRRIKTLVDENMAGGEHEYVFELGDEEGFGLANGIYFLHLETEGERKSSKLMVLR